MIEREETARFREPRRLLVELGENSYPIWIGEGLMDRLAEKLPPLQPGARIFILTDHHVDAFYGDWAERILREAGYPTRRLSLEPGEATKAFGSLPPIYEALLDFQCTRKDLMITLGGGVIGDLGGFAAATFLRGMPFVQIPTSLLAQVDSSVGGKVAVDLPQGKNLVGCFYQPKAVLIDPLLLQTLPERYFRDGMAEVIKYGCIRDAAFLERLAGLADRNALMAVMTDIIETCCRHKKSYVEADERDLGLRMHLNFGHTLGHAIEASEHYEGHSHGEAVAMGMAAITRISEAMSLTQPGTAEKLEKLLRQHGLPCRMPVEKRKEILAAIATDKKNLGRTLKVVLLKTLGESYLWDASPAFFDAAAGWRAE